MEHPHIYANPEEPASQPALCVTPRRTVRGISRWLPWVEKGSLAFVDQALISGSNFLLSVLLARWLIPEQYGAYALAFSIFLFIASFHQALVLEPMSVLGPVSYRDRQREYLGALLWINAALSLVIITVLGFTAFAADHFALPGGFPGALGGLTPAAPFLLLFWLARRATYLKLSPGPATAGASLYSALLLGGLLMVYRRGELGPSAAFLLMGFGALVVSSLLLVRLKPAVRLGIHKDILRGVWRQHWRYGRWALATAVVIWIPGNIFYVLTGAFLGMGEVGGLKALMNIVLPVGHSVAAFSMLFLPYVSGIFGQRGISATRAPVHKIALLYVGGAVVYSFLVSYFREPIFYFLYGGKFMEFVPLVPWAAASTVFWVGAHGFCIGLRAIQSPSAVFVVFCASGAVSIIIGIPATWAFGLPGSIGALVLSTLTALIAASFLFRRKVQSVVKAEG